MPALNSPLPSTYRGRFAPTPSGPLHLGSLVTALASYLCARVAGGRWLLRVDDLDTPRVMPGATDQILRQLEAHGLLWDEAPQFQSGHVAEYAAALGRLQRESQVYACHCTRAELREMSRPGADEPVYSGRCRDAGHDQRGAALRLRLPDVEQRIEDRWRGILSRRLQEDLGDFILRRRDGQLAYQLASAIDEARMGISEIIRGEDLLASSFRQAYLMQVLHLPVPRHGHLPLVRDAEGRKLSKQNHAPALDPANAQNQLVQALNWLGHPVPKPLEKGASIVEMHQWALTSWASGPSGSGGGPVA